ncbi:uncharacterized membrane protein YhaH (DUF805 family) [Streptomyces umbrinus]|uniref:Uncharacterized membrane protein YhaH (DUF805 family) n=1 Tax=Streptomyces umbrinus TaxID=67370 RepID=A0ABU0TBQ0_9ACTN|nr:DUF805 domain-containing protein [Streptomyces umbrinus]MDQ1033180.1 uncharacterized membrane protein YhaH (DUF805 family) [Streptomyces umbrinus]
MRFKQAVVHGLTKAVDWKGRASRSEYWWFLLFCVLCYIPSIDLTVQLDSPVVAFVWLALIVPTLGVFVRRLHDRNRSGWWWFLGFVPFGPLC